MRLVNTKVLFQLRRKHYDDERDDLSLKLDEQPERITISSDLPRQ